MATTRHRSLLERGGRMALLETLQTQKKNVKKKLIFTNLKKKIRANRASSKATARSVEDETLNAEVNGNRNPEWWTKILI